MTQNDDSQRSADGPDRPRLPRPTSWQWSLIAAAAAAYAVGYPLALSMHQPIGWLFVTLGGVFLIALAGLTVVRIHRDQVAEPPAELPQPDHRPDFTR